MAKVTTDTLELASTSSSQSQARKARHSIPACSCEARHAISTCIAKSHCIKGAARAQNRRQAVGVRRTQYRGSAELALQYIRKLGKA